jgi:hypothetical protein
VRPDAEREAHQGEHQRGHGEREALVQLDVVGGRDLALAVQPIRLADELAERQLLLGLLFPGGGGEGRVDRQAHVVEAEVGLAEAPAVAHVALADRAVQEAQGDAAGGLVAQEPALAGHDDARLLRVPLVRDEQALEPHLRGAHLVHVDHELVERRAEGALLDAGGGARLEDAEELTLEGPARPRADHQGEPGDEQGRDDAHRQEGAEETERAHPGGLERGHLEVARQPPADQQHRHQQRHR